MLYVQAKEGGQSSGMSWNTTGRAEYRLCTHWDGPRHGMASQELFRLRRSVLALKPGERLQFYCVSESGEGTGVDGDSPYQASTTCLGPGQYLTTFREPHQTTTRREPTGDPGTIPISAFANAELIRTATGALLDLKGIPGPHIGDPPFRTLGPDNLNLTEGQWARLYTVELTEAELGNWDRLSKTIGGTVQAKPEFDGSWSFSATVSATLPDLGEVILESDSYASWIPEGNAKLSTKPGNSLKVKARMHRAGKSDQASDRKATFTFRLEKVSSEPGVCLNFPKNPPSDAKDLRFLAEENPRLEWVSETELRTRQPVSEAEVVISSFDFGAYGALRVTAEDDQKKKLAVHFQGRELNTLALPKDDTGGHIADAWREKEGAVGLLATWDEASIPGQDAKGDGLTLYQKYRGLLVSEGGTPVYTRLKAKEKVHFVLDEADVFDTERWRTSTGGIRAYKVVDSIHENRRVDFNTSGAPGNGGYGKRATRIEVMKGVVEGQGMPDEKGNILPEYEPRQYAYTAGLTAGTNTRLRIFPDRILDMLSRVKASMRKELTNPQGKEELTRAAYLLTLGTKEDLLRQLDEVNLATRTQALVALSAIHEMGHVFTLQGHLNQADEEGEGLGSSNCPMHYLDWQERRHFFLTGALTGEGRFCNTSPCDCFKSLNPKG